MTCNYCGAQNPDMGQFCIQCGRQLADDVTVSTVRAMPTQDSGNVATSEMYAAPTADMYPTEAAWNVVSSAPEAYTQPSAEAEASQAAAAGTFSAVNVGPFSPQDGAMYGPPMPGIPQVSAGGAAPVARQSRLKGLAQPLPIWVVVSGTALVMLLLILLQLSGSDWAEGAMRAGIAAGVAACLIAAMTLVRTLVGMRRVGQFVSAGLAVVLLFLLCGAGLTQQSGMHSLQASALESQHQWQRAMTEFQLAGESAPTSTNIARIYTEWGEQLSSGQSYEAAIAKFDTVLDSYGPVSREVARAQSDKIGAYMAWGKQAMQKGDFTDGATRFDDVLNLPYCNDDCQANAKAQDAAAYYGIGKAELSSQQYTNAVNTFALIVTRFPSSTEAQQLHPDYAKALLGQGKQEFATSCSSAIPTYQELASKFADTLEGQQAKSALQAPQQVKGHFVTSIPQSPNTAVVVLTQNLTPSISQTGFFQLIAGDATVGIASNGTFTFKAVPQGTYELAWGTNNNDGNRSFYFSYSGNTINYVAHVGPLCAFNYGDINEPIPTAP